MGENISWKEMREEQSFEIAAKFVKDSIFRDAEQKWKNKDYDKKAFLQYISDFGIDILGIEKEIKVELYKDDSYNSSYGLYNASRDKTSINEKSYFYDRFFYRVLNTVSHESLGHGYQDFVIENKEIFLQLNPDMEDQIRILEHSFNSKMEPAGGDIEYKGRLNYIIYIKDPAEIDAFRMGKNIEDTAKKHNEEQERK